jgi:twitching motility protein PilT
MSHAEFLLLKNKKMWYNTSMAEPTNPYWAMALSRNASDIHLVTGNVPMLRIDGVMTAVEGDVMTEEMMHTYIREFLSEEDYQKFLKIGDIDCAYALPDGTRFRINVHLAMGKPAFAARLIPNVIPTIEEVMLQPVVMDICRNRDGLVLFTGPTGSGKSTSLAAIINQFNLEAPVNIITLEDPIEFYFKSNQSLIRQRELGTDFPSFPEGMKHLLRQDPDIVMVGEMRDLETVSLALTLAETGHLVLATLHTPNTMQTVDRIIDVFPPHQQTQVRYQLSLSLRAIIAQRLVAKKGGGLIANREILIKNAAVANIIREQRLAELPSVLQTSEEEGMITFEKDLKRLIKEGLVEEGQ